MNNNNPYKMYKKAGTVSDTVSEQLWSRVPYLGALHGPVGLISTFTAPDDIESVKKYNAKPVTAIAPFVGTIRNVARRKAITKHLTKGKNSKRSLLHEIFGPLASITAGAGVGALVGNQFGTSAEDTYKGALIGTGVAGGVYLLGSLMAALTPTRTTEQQKEYENGSMASNWLIPGVASYNYWKALGYARDQEKPGGIFAPNSVKVKSKKYY